MRVSILAVVVAAAIPATASAATPSLGVVLGPSLGEVATDVDGSDLHVGALGLGGVGTTGAAWLAWPIGHGFELVGELRVLQVDEPTFRARGLPVRRADLDLTAPHLGVALRHPLALGVHARLGVGPMWVRLGEGDRLLDALAPSRTGVAATFTLGRDVVGLGPWRVGLALSALWGRVVDGDVTWRVRAVDLGVTVAWR